MYLKLGDYLMARIGVLRPATNRISGVAVFFLNWFAVQLDEEEQILYPIRSTETLSVLQVRRMCTVLWETKHTWTTSV